jgi:TolB-like protein
MANSRTGSDERRTIHTVIAEFSRREVFKAAGLYAGGAWLLAEILLAVLERSPFSESSRALAGCVIVSLFIGGFPVVLVLAWFFDLTRGGDHREQPMTRGRPAAAVAGLGMVLIGTVLLMWQVNPCGLGRVLGIAVLPCSYYGDADSAYRAPGFSQELNYRLSHLKQLRVPSWPSTAYFSRRVPEPAALAESLNIDRLVECGMRRSESRVSVNLQLFDPASDQNLWADEYQGQSSDELLLIAEAFRDLIGVDALNVSARAGGRIERVNSAPTASAEAWSLFQRARAAETTGDHARAADLNQQAVGLDSTFARAQAAVARRLWQDARQDGVSAADREARLKAAAARTQRALVESPRLPDALALWRELLGTGVGQLEGPTDGALPTDPDRLHEIILELRPSFAEESRWWAHWLETQGRKPEAEAARASASRLDPAGLVD